MYFPFNPMIKKFTFVCKYNKNIYFEKPNVMMILCVPGGCNDEEGSLTGRGYKQQRYLHFVRDAVYAVAHALHELRIETCGENTIGICEGMHHLNETKFIELLRGVTFNGINIII